MKEIMTKNTASINPALVYLAGLAESGRRTQAQALSVIAKMLTGSPDITACNWATLRFQHTSVIRFKLAKVYAPATVNKMLCSLRGTLKAAWLSGQMTGEEYHKAVVIDGFPVDTPPAGRDLSSREIAALMLACEDDPTPSGGRDAAIIALLYAGGLRREEVIDLDLADYDPGAGRLLIRGKHHKERFCYITDEVTDTLADWLVIRGYKPGPLFLPINKGGARIQRRMTTPAIYNLLAKRADQAGIKKFTPHDLRRSFVSDLLDAGADLTTVAKMAGDALLATTARYDRRPEEAKRKAAGLLHIPYRAHRNHLT